MTTITIHLFLLQMDEVLVNSLISGEKIAFEKLYIKYRHKLYSYFHTIFINSFTAEDLVQETFIKIWEKRETICPQMPFTAYLFTIAHHKAISHIRRLKIEKMFINQCVVEDTEDTTLTDLISKEYEVLLKKTTEKLPPKRKLVFQLSREKGLSHKEIAKQLGISIHTVQEHISESITYFKINLLNNPEINILVNSTPKQ